MKLSNNTEWLFFHLWKKNPETLRSYEGICLAETIFYRWAQPYFWYHTSNERLIIRKTKEKVVLTQVEANLLINIPKCGIVASNLSAIEDVHSKSQEKIDFEYLDQSEFKEFIYQREKTSNAIVQKFIEPKHQRNSLIKVSWTPQFCLLFRKTNIHDINNTKIPLINRLVTFEGPEHLSTADSISSPLLATEIEQTCLGMVKHIEMVSGGNIQISKMVMYMKIDEDNKLWLLFCTGLKFREKYHPQKSLSTKKKNERNLSPILCVAPNHKKEDIKKKKRFNQNNNNFLLDDEMTMIDNVPNDLCLRCEKDGPLYLIALKLLLDDDEEDLKQEQVEVKLSEALIMNDNIDFQNIKNDINVGGNNNNFDMKNDNGPKKIPGVPGIIYKLYHNVTKDKYELLKENSDWLNTQFNVCEDCYLKMSEKTLENSELRNAKKNQKTLKEKSKKENDDGFSLKNLADDMKLYKPEKEDEVFFNAPHPNLSKKKTLNGPNNNGVRPSINLGKLSHNQGFINRESDNTNNVNNNNANNGNSPLNTNNNPKMYESKSTDKLDRLNSNQTNTNTIPNTRTKINMGTHVLAESTLLKKYERKIKSGIITKNFDNGENEVMRTDLDDYGEREGNIIGGGSAGSGDDRGGGGGDERGGGGIFNQTALDTEKLPRTQSMKISLGNYNNGINSHGNHNNFPKNSKNLPVLKSEHKLPLIYTKSRSGLSSKGDSYNDTKGIMPDSSKSDLIWRNTNHSIIHRNNYSGVLSTIKDLKKFLIDNEKDIEEYKADPSIVQQLSNSVDI